MARIAKTTTKKLTAKGAKQLEEARAKRIYVRKAKPVNEIIAEEVTKTMNAIGEEAKARRQIDQMNADDIQSLRATVVSQGLQITNLQARLDGTATDQPMFELKVGNVTKKLDVPNVNLIHEWVEGSHRILIVDAKGVRTGKWAARNEIAVLEEYRAAGSFFDGIFPAGVFKATEVQFAGLGG